MDIFEKVTNVTDDFDTIVEVVCPELRPPVYYLERIFSPDWQYNPDYATKFIASIGQDKLIELTRLLHRLSSMTAIQTTDSIEGIIKNVLEYSYSFSFGKNFKDTVQSLSRWFGSKPKSDTDQETIFNVGESILNICNNISESKTYPDLSQLLCDKSMVRPITFSILAIYKIVESKLVTTKLTNLEIANLCFLYWASIMRYHLKNMNEDMWLPQITNLIARNGGRFFRVCKITLREKEVSTPLYMTLFPNYNLSRAVNPDWHEQLYSSFKFSELLTTYKALHKLFLFHIIDQILSMCADASDKGKSIEDIFGKLQPYPDYSTIQRYFNLYLGTPVYTEKINCSLWEPDKLLYKLFMSHYPDYNNCLDAMRNEYFPEEMFDLKSLVSAACEFYDDKIHLDVSYNNIHDSNMLDNLSIWLTSEWIINNRNYPFLDGITLNGLSDMIGSAITESTQ
ncbi:MAG: hypothetical protein K2I69_07455 [Muribaculaceae bacterium]|nr:hypothetical protein [Muribaculaceae bacterium]